MKSQIIKIVCVVSVLFTFSCNKREATNSDKQNEIPEALQEGKSFAPNRFKSKSESLVNQLYYDLVEKTPALKSLEDEIGNFNPNDTIATFYNYDRKSKDYYSSANNLTEEISDSITKNKIIALLKKSNEKYKGTSKEVSELISSIGDKNSAIKDYHTVLKIVLTLPLIEKYQTQNLPNKNNYQNIIKKQDSIIAKTQKATPKL